MKQLLLKYPQDTERTVICRSFAHQRGIPKCLTLLNMLESVLKDQTQYALLINYNSLFNLQIKDEYKMQRVFLRFLWVKRLML